MNRIHLTTITLFIMAFSLFPQASKAQLKVGDKIPTFTLPDQNGQQFNVANEIGKRPMVIYFYPKDDTPGCTKEACSFRDSFEEFSDLGAIVIGISSGSVASHKKFAEKYKLPFTLLADESNQVRKLFGVPKTFVLPGRVTYVVDKNGIIIHYFNSMTNAAQHVQESLTALKKQ
ncbi:peroxiredoxin Q/BCP [Chitinophaga skermanii]|uniref:thioredoxin-dependent peroxiredoxin n=2 Tax=Chitinophaga skermanii TaxID=331697 RepID=A0A327QQZ6_9BACT|nr:peroxiredoxin Q/BCP [Chitinophaga skermanii]